jgi:hypothetical protein
MPYYYTTKQITQTSGLEAKRASDDKDLILRIEIRRTKPIPVDGDDLQVTNYISPAYYKLTREESLIDYLIAQELTKALHAVLNV